jgi:hypothetical protein
MPDSLDRKLDAIGRQPFRAKFHLRGRERVTAEQAAPATLRLHARDLVTRRLAPAEPYHDGKQTPTGAIRCSWPSTPPRPAAGPACSGGTR